MSSDHNFVCNSDLSINAMNLAAAHICSSILYVRVCVCGPYAPCGLQVVHSFIQILALLSCEPSHHTRSEEQIDLFTARGELFPIDPHDRSLCIVPNLTNSFDGWGSYSLNKISVIATTSLVCLFTVKVLS
jgi:hypothetical protein